MATPISQLANGAMPTSGGGAEDDPMIHDVLQDMETKMTAPPAPQQQRPQQQPHPQQPQMRPPARYPISYPGGGGGHGGHGIQGLWDIELAKRSVIIAVIAFIILNPAIIQALFKTVPLLETYLGDYAQIVSVLLLIAVLYAVAKFTKLI